MNNYFKTLTNKEDPYEINTELKVRKLLEQNSHYTYEYSKNDDKYGYDIEVIKYFLNNGYRKETIGYIEVEVSYTWINDWPKYWKSYSFMKRKVYEYDGFNNVFIDRLKQNVNKTLYVVFNNQFTDCYCSSMSEISQFGTESNNKTQYNRTDQCLRTSLNDSRVIRGLDNCIKHINKVLENREIFYIQNETTL